MCLKGGGVGTDHAEEWLVIIQMLQALKQQIKGRKPVVYTVNLTDIKETEV